MAGTEIRVGIVGAGENTRLKHLPNLLQLPGVRVAGVVNRSRASSARVAAEFSIPRLYDRWEQAVEDPDTDAIVIGTWPDLHAAVTCAALAAGKHVLCEARMARDAAEAHAMRKASRARPDLVAQVVPAPFSLGVDATVARWLAEHRLGDLLVVEQRSAPAWPDRTAPLHWRQDRDRSGCNALWLGIVYEMLLRWGCKAVNVTAAARTFVATRPDPQTGAPRAVTVPDHVDALAELTNGAHLHLQQSAVLGGQVAPGTWLHGTEGALRFHDGRLTELRKGDSEWREVGIPPGERGGWRVEEEFIHAIRGVEPVRRTTFDDGVRYMEFTEAVARSAATGRRIGLPLESDAAS